ncbi:hypothetical protein HYFRA_00014114 [Hymenoscyphus fraxineus]|uniref:Aminotransferase class I/classII large domain-containing protein n=1 Tax=Hymenoscyphus fraxineus TaxID=746836 RepID=A0A9N9L829_9HELO|nr:hypothetical protein HYFRA_00014114 [Hymenoscyphus fraxineus]
MYADGLIKKWAEEHRIRGSTTKNQPAFYRNLERFLDSRRQGQNLMGLKPRWDETVADFTTCDFLSLSRSGRVREEFLNELARYPDFDLGAAGSRILYGNYPYLNQTEQEIAEFHGVEAVHLTQSGFAANVGVLSGVPLPGDAIVYDELVHASSHEGFHLSLAEYKLPFRHNDPDSLRDTLATLKYDQPEFEAGVRSVLVCVESIYSMDGDVCLLQEFVQVVREEFPNGNAQFVVDEAHSLGIIGEKGKGLVSLLGLEKEIAIRIHVASKSLGCVGGKVNLSVYNPIIYCAPSFPMVASIRSAYQLLMRGETEEAQQKIQNNVKHFFAVLTSNPVWDTAVDEGLLDIPLLEDWTQRPFQTHIVPLPTRAGHEMLVFFQLILNNMNAYPMAFPVVPKGQSRVRLIFHAHNTFGQIEDLASKICEWATEMLEIEKGDSKNELPKSARQAYSIRSEIEVME